MTDQKPVNLWFAIPSDMKPGIYEARVGPKFPRAINLDSIAPSVPIDPPLLVGPAATENVAIRIDTGEIVLRWPVAK